MKLSDMTPNQVTWINEFEILAGYTVNEWHLEKLLEGSLSWEEFMSYERNTYRDVVRQNIDYIDLMWSSIVEDEGE